MVKQIQNAAIGIFIVSVAVLTLVAVLAIWDVFSKDTLYKSLSTIGVLAFSSLVVIVATRAIDKHNSNDAGGSTPPNQPQNFS